MKIILFFLFSLPVLAQNNLHTLAEKSQWIKTGRADEVKRLCQNFARTYPTKVKCLSYGKTPEGRELYFLIAGERLGSAPVVWAQAGIHAGEIDGKDAVFWLLKDIFSQKLKTLRGVTLVFIPIVNLDGHERFGKWNRPNQLGPEEMGWRTTAQNLNMNRDFIKADAPEMQALIKLWRKVDPIVSLDLHVTNGAQFQPEVGLIVLPTSFHGSSPLHLAGKELEDGLMIKMKEKNQQALPFYPAFQEEDKPLSGFARYVSTPRFSQGYWFNQNRLGVLVETHSWKNYAQRVKSQYFTVQSVLELTQKHAKSWMRAAKEKDLENLATKKVDLEYTHSSVSRTIDFPGYKFEMIKSDISNSEYIRYYPDQPQIWTVPFFEELKASLTVEAPSLGYFVPKAHAAWIKEKLDLHGIYSSVWSGKVPSTLQAFRAEETTFSTASFEGRQTLSLKGKWENEDVILPKGPLFVPIKQARARLVLQLFEPLARDSFVSWGFFNKAFEQKEYMEKYVAEEVALEMMKDPVIKKEFEDKLKADELFAKDPAKRLEFFYRKHPSWDKKFNLYPVYKK